MRRILILLAFLVAGWMLLARLGGPPLTQPDEGRNAEVAREVQQSGTWLLPTYNGVPYLDKPICYFKVVALSFAAFGESAFTARLPSVLFALVLLVMVFAFGRRAYNETAGALAVIIIATTPLFVMFGRWVIMDMMLAFFVCAAIWAGYLAEEQTAGPRARWYLLGAAAAAFGTLVKGPIGFILPTLVLGVFNWLDGRQGWVRRFFAPLNFVVFFAITLPWFIGVSLQRPDFPAYGLLYESFQRFSTNSFRRSGPFYYYVPWILAGSFPWSLLLPEAVFVAVRTRRHWTRPDRLLVVWSVVTVVFFSLSKSKLPGYILTVMVALGLLVASVIARALAQPQGRAARIVRHSTWVLVWLSSLAAVFLITCDVRPDALVARLHLHSEEFKQASVLLPILLWPVLASLVLAALALWRRNVWFSLVALAVLPLLIATMEIGPLMRYAEDQSALPLARHLPTLPAETTIVCYQTLPTGLPFYLRRTLSLITNNGKELTSNYAIYCLQQPGPWPPQLIPLADAERWLASQTQPVYLLTRERFHEALATLVTPYGVSLQELVPGWYGVLIPTPGGR